MQENTKMKNTTNVKNLRMIGNGNTNLQFALDNFPIAKEKALNEKNNCKHDYAISRLVQQFWREYCPNEQVVSMKRYDYHKNRS